MSVSALLSAIVNSDRITVKKLLRADSSLATAQVRNAKLYQSGIFHWLYAGDTALHLAAAGYRVEIVKLLLAAGPIRTRPAIAAQAVRCTTRLTGSSPAPRGTPIGRSRQSTYCSPQGRRSTRKTPTERRPCTAPFGPAAPLPQNACSRPALVRRCETSPGPRRFILRCRTRAVAGAARKRPKRLRHRSSGSSWHGASVRPLQTAMEKLC